MVLTAALIGLDWGTTSLRAYRMDGAGTVLEFLDTPQGLLNVPGGDFAGVFAEVVGPWLEPAVPVIAAGMVGSRQGWREVPYVPVPAGAGDLAANMIAVEAPGATVHVVPGVCDPSAPDVMRGEEVQIFGAGGDGVFVLPGTHSKWALVEGGTLAWFATFMTGEVFDLMARHSILARMMTEADDEAAFARGVAAAKSADANLLRQLFGVRALGLFDRLAETESRAYLSGLLIGSEIRHGLEAAALAGGTPPVMLVGSAGLTSRYARALETFGVGHDTAAADITSRGLFAIAARAGLTR